MPIWKIAQGTCGLVLLVTAVAAFQFPDLFPAVQLAKVERVDGTAEITSRHQAVTAGPFIFDTIIIEIRYPRRIRKDKTLYVEAQANQLRSIVELNPADPAAPISTDPPPGSGPLKTLAWPIRLALSGAAFDIDPRERSFPEGAALPLSFAWTAFPKSTGSHTLLLDWPDIAPREFGWWPGSADTKVSVNDRPVISASNLISLPVEVVTKWGITQFWADVGAGLISLIGFLLGLPVLGWLWTRFTGSKKAES